MLTYLDTSALAKWYLNEVGSEAFCAWVQEQDDLHVSSLTELEFRCLLARRRRRKEISISLAAQLFAAFRSDVDAGHLIHHCVEDCHVTGAVNLLDYVAPIGLRTLDAMHLCIARDIGAAVLATADGTMADAAKFMGLRVEDFGH